MTATPDENNQEWWKRLHDYFDESLSAYENVENSGNERGEYADLDKGVSSDADAGKLSGEETVKEDKPSRKELELERLLRAVESRLQTVEMESTKLKEELAYLQKEKDAPHEKALSVPQVKQELSYAADDVHTMALDDDAKCLPFFSTILNTPKDTGAEYMNEELRNGSYNKEPLSKQPYVPFSMHTRSRDYRPLDKQPEDKLVQDNAKVDSLLVSRDTVVVDETADKP
ncbi:hypothetical protein Tco_0735423 [Tanacetum coccineum]